MTGMKSSANDTEQMTFVTGVDRQSARLAQTRFAQMCRRIIIVLLLLTIAITSASTQHLDIPRQGRQIVLKVPPIYPYFNNSMRISGVVKLRATIAPNGSVKSIQVLGGNPVLIKAALEAVPNWKYAPAPKETHELIDLHFDPPRLDVY
jgi:TonB family protein